MRDYRRELEQAIAFFDRQTPVPPACTQLRARLDAVLAEQDERARLARRVWAAGVYPCSCVQPPPDSLPQLPRRPVTTPAQLARIGQLSDQWSFLWDKRRSLWIAAEDCPDGEHLEEADLDVLLSRLPAVVADRP
ncbi:MAG: hypothetical protein ABSB76_27210 [Streptosporangiaceae bacterium]